MPACRWSPLTIYDHHHTGTISCGEQHASTDLQRQPLISGLSLFDYADRSNTRIPSSCARSGSCHECVVQIDAGIEALSQRTDTEKFLKDPFRLACQTKITDLCAEISYQPLRRTPRILTEGRPVDPQPNLSENACVPEVTDNRHASIRSHELGLAIDIGTTTIVIKVIDLETERTVVTASFANPQGFAGSDIMHRISYAASQYTSELQRAIVNAINSEIRMVARNYGFRRTQVTQVVVAGNPTMRDILFGLDVQALGQRPYRSTVEAEFRTGLRTSTALEAPARQLGLHFNPRAYVLSLPIIGSHVGADTAACLLAIGMADLDQPVMLVDVGTNTEVVVGHRDRMIACSCPAGPAFEGGSITYGMPAYEGAIEALTWDNGNFSYRTIGDIPAEGICGSGFIDLLAELRRNSMITPKGVFTVDRRLKQIDVVPGSITFSRADASTLAQAKPLITAVRSSPCATSASTQENCIGSILPAASLRMLTHLMQSTLVC